MDERTWDEFHSNVDPLPFENFGGHPTNFSTGGVDNSALIPGYWGWIGFGGSVLQWCPDHEISFSYVPVDLNYLVDNTARGKNLARAVTECVGSMHGGDWGDDSDDDKDEGMRMGDKPGMIDWSEDKDRIIMTGSDGSMIFIEMGAVKLAASVLTLAAMTLY